jgi:hypothetical protein
MIIAGSANLIGLRAVAACGSVVATQLSAAALSWSN